jgi:flagellar P-ring protein precursor FlgI
MRTLILLMMVFSFTVARGAQKNEMQSVAIAAMAEAVAAAESGPDLTDPSRGVRLKDLCDIDGVRENQLIGIGLVVGLSGTGDKSPAAVGMLRRMLNKHLQSVSEGDLASKNVAMVAVTADLPAYARQGSRLFTQVSCIGDAVSLKGGTLLQTALVGPDDKKTVYAVAQGPVSIGGFGSASPAVTVIGNVGTDHINILTVAVLTPGALVEREVPVTLLYGDRLRLVLRDSDFTTASRVANTLGELFGHDRVIAQDATMITLGFPTPPSDSDLVDTIAKLQQIRVAPDVKARVVINSRTGTVVSGNYVRISQVAVSHGGLSLRIGQITRENIDARGVKTEEKIWTDTAKKKTYTKIPGGVHVSDVTGSVSVIEAASVDDVSNALNALGARPRDMVAIFEAIQRAGALHAELVVM